MRYTGTKARGIRLPIINYGDNLEELVVEYLVNASQAEGFTIQDNDVVGITEALVAKTQGNYASLDQLAKDVRQKFPDGIVGVVFPILSRNRFFNILKGIIKGADEVYVLLSYPADEVGNPIMDIQKLDEVIDMLKNHTGPIPAAEFKEIAGEFIHPFTDIDYIKLYESAGAKVYFSMDPRDILKLTPHVIAADIHTRFITQNRLKKAGAKTALTLSDILSQPVDGSGYNPDYGVLGSNISSDEKLKLFPKDGNKFVLNVQKLIKERMGVCPHVMVYGDGAFKDPHFGIWELADPVVSPGFTKGLDGQPHEIKMKMVADTRLAGMSGEEQQKAMKDLIRKKANEIGSSMESEAASQDSTEAYSLLQGTTPRKYYDLIGSLCDLIGGSGDKGTPVVLVQGYFDSYADE